MTRLPLSPRLPHGAGEAMRVGWGITGMPIPGLNWIPPLRAGSRIRAETLPCRVIAHRFCCRSFPPSCRRQRNGMPRRRDRKKGIPYRLPGTEGWRAGGAAPAGSENSPRHSFMLLVLATAVAGCGRY